MFSQLFRSAICTTLALPVVFVNVESVFAQPTEFSPNNLPNLEEPFWEDNVSHPLLIAQNTWLGEQLRTGSWKVHWIDQNRITYDGTLQMNEGTGIMVLRVEDSDGSFFNVEQEMRFVTGSRDGEYILYGYSPCDPRTGESLDDRYIADNFYVKTRSDGSFSVRNCDDGDWCGSTSLEFLGY